MDVTIVGGAGVALIVVIYRLLTERSEIRDLRKDFAELKLDFTKLETRYAYQRHRSHLYREIITKQVGYVDLAAMLANEALAVMRQSADEGVQPLTRLLEPIADTLAKLHAESDVVLTATEKEPDPE